MPRNHALRLALILLANLGCSTPERPHTADASADRDDGPKGDGIGGRDGGGTDCRVNAVPLMVVSAGNEPSRLYAPITHEGRDAALFVDTGSSLTFLTLSADEPDYVPRAGTITIGCESLDVPGRRVGSDAAIEGLPVIGYLGADFFLGARTELDIAGARIVRHLGDAPAHPAWTPAPYEDRVGHVLVDVALDGEAVTLMLDTGSPHTLWLGKDGRPGDFETSTTDAQGNPLPLWYGPSTLGWSGEPERPVPVLRAPSFPYFEQTVAALGGGIHGLLGLTSLGDRRLEFDPTARVIHREPLP